MSSTEVRRDDDGTVHLGPRTIPLPQSISDQARQVLSAPASPPFDYPPIDDKAGWRDMIAEREEAFAPLADMVIQGTDGKAAVETKTIAGATVHVGTPLGAPGAHRDRAMIVLHGGAFIILGGAWARAEALLTADEWGCTAYSVDYRMPPDHPYPAALDDIVGVYADLLEAYRPEDVVVTGNSAGGNLALAAVLRARDEGLPLPGAVLAITPEADLTESGDTFETLRHIDPRLPEPLPQSIAVYADGHDLTHPYLSPLFADFGAGFPPTYVQSGTRDLFLSNSVRVHRALRNAGVDAELHVWEAALHGGFTLTGAPEADEEHEEKARFLAKHWGRGSGVSS